MSGPRKPRSTSRSVRLFTRGRIGYPLAPKCATTSPLPAPAEHEVEDAPRVAAGAQEHRPGISGPEASIAKIACAFITLPPRTQG